MKWFFKSFWLISFAMLSGKNHICCRKSLNICSYPDKICTSLGLMGRSQQQCCKYYHVLVSQLGHPKPGRARNWQMKRCSTSLVTRKIQIKPQSDNISHTLRSDQIRSVAQSCPTLCNPRNRSTPGLPVHHQLPEFTETHVHRVSDAIQPLGWPK